MISGYNYLIDDLLPSRIRRLPQVELTGVTLVADLDALDDVSDLLRDLQLADGRSA